MPPKKIAAKKVSAVKFPVRASRKKVEIQEEDSSDEESYHSEEPVKSPSLPASSDDESTKKSTKKASEKGESSEKGSQKPKRKRNFGLILTTQQEVDMGEWLRGHPMLYVRTLSTFKDGQKKRALWSDKAELLGVESGVMLETWYKSIRTRISKMMKDDAKSGSATIHRTDRDKFIDTNFGFLKGCIVRKEGRSAIQLKIMHKAAPTATHEGESSGFEMEVERDRSDEDAEDGEQPECSGVVADVADVPTLHQKVTKGKKGGRGGVKNTGKRTIHESSDDEQMTVMLQELSQQQKTAAEIHGRIEGLLTKDQQSSASAWGTWMGTLAQQIDIRLHPALYRQATDIMMEYIDASSKLPPHVPGQQLQLPLRLQTPQQPPQQLPQQPPQQPPPQPTPQPPPQPPQPVSGEQPGPGVSYQTLMTQQVPYQPQQSHWSLQPQWNTPAPAAGQPEASRPSSTPNMSLPSFGNLSGTLHNMSSGSLTGILLDNDEGKL